MGSNEYAVKGTGYKLKICLYNSSVLSIHNIVFRVGTKAVSDVDYTWTNHSLDMDSNSKAYVEIDIDTTHVGVCKVAIGKMYAYDDMAIFRRKLMYHDMEYSIYVVPNYHSNSGFAEGYGQMKNLMYYDNLAGSESDIMDIREYAPGDKLNLMHWKLTSKYEKPFVKVLSSPAVSRDIIAFENMDVAKEIRDVMFEGLMSLMFDKLSEVGMYTLLYMNGDESVDTLIETKEQIIDMIIRILDIKPQRSSDLKRILESPEYRNGNIYYIGCHEDVAYIRENDETEYIGIRKWLIYE